jgi:putative hemolysin
MGGIPAANDSFEAVGLRFEVANMDGKRVDKVVVQPLPSSDSGNREGEEPRRPT